MVVAVPATGWASADGHDKAAAKTWWWHHSTPSAGARTLGDPLLPQIGNGGCDARHYRIYLNYDPVTNEFLSAKTSTGRTLPVYNAVDSSAEATAKAQVQASLDMAPGQLNFLSDLYGPYPFDSTGAVADSAAGVGYALEVQGKPHYAGSFTTGVPSISLGTQLHELAHQWFGNSVTLQTRADIWFNEGWANWSQWYWSAQVQGGKDPAVGFDELYADTPSEDWEVAPAILDGDPANLFKYFPTYQRGAMTLQGYREIVGDTKFFGLAKRLVDKYEHANISTAEFIVEAKRASGFSGSKLTLLEDYFQQWLYGETKPTILPENFA